MSNDDKPDESELDRVMRRIQKLLAKTKDGAGTTEGEADTAMKMVQELMMKYNLDMAVIEAASQGGNAGTVRVKEQMAGRAMYKWQQQLAKYVSEANFCYHLIKNDMTWIDGHDKEDEYGDSIWVPGRRKTVKSHIFVGRKGNVITAQMMYQYLTQTVEDLVPVANKDRLSRSAVSWKEGCSDRLCERLASRRADLIKQHDIRVRQADADQKAANARAAKEAGACVARQLEPNQGAEVKAATDRMRAVAYDATGVISEADPDPERPEADPDDAWTPGDTATPADEPATSTALVLASVYDKSEQEANYELANGLEPGTLARWRAEREERERKAAEEMAKDTTDKLDEPTKKETERQRSARERREADAHAKQRRRWAREDDAAWRREQREHAKRDHVAYQAGAERGKHIGLDPQVSAAPDQKKLGGK